MAKRKVGIQIGILTFDHGTWKIDQIPLCVGGVRHTVGKLSTRAKTFGWDLVQIKGLHQKL
jgi:hypothetical protein